MDNQKINIDKIDSSKLAETVGKEIEPISPDETIITENYQNEKKETLTNYAKDIIYLDSDSLKNSKIFSLLLEIKEKYPEMSLTNFVENYFENNGNATPEMIRLVFSIAKKVERYFNNPENNNFESMDLEKLELKRKKMTLALNLVGVFYKSKPSIETLSEDFYNVIINKGNVNHFDFSKILNSITKVVDKTAQVGTAVGQVVQTTGNLVNSFSGRNDVVIQDVPYTAQQAVKIYETETKKVDYTNYFIFGSIGIAVIFLVIFLLRK